MDDPVPQKKPLETGTPAAIGGKAEPHLMPGGNSYESFQAANAAPDPRAENELAAQKRQNAEDTIKELHKEQPIPNLRTYESDVAEAVKESNISVVSIAAKKIQQRNPLDSARTPQENPSDSKSGLLGKISMILGTLVLIAASLAALGYVFIVIKSKPAPEPTLINETGNIISVDDVKTVTVSPGQNTLAAFLGAEKTLGQENAAIVQIDLTPAGTTTVMDSQTFLTDLGLKSMPAWFIRSIGPEYVAGFYHDSENWDPFFLLSVASYDNAFAGMLQWEAGMGSDLAPFYQASPNNSADTETSAAILPVGTTTANTATSTNAASSTYSANPSVTLQSPPSFQDTFIDNKNVRVFSAPGQNPLLLYSFPEQNVLVITTTRAALEEIFNRLVAGQFVR